MPTPNVTLEQLRAGIERAAGKMHKLVLHRIGAHFLELDLSFAHHSVVFLPVQPVDTSVPKPKVPRPAQLVMLKHLFDYAAQHPGQKLLIAGHTDTSGSAFVNQRFSEARANSVYALLKGDRELWAKCCETRHETTDMQALLKWAAREHGFGCDPGEVDGKTGPKTIRAREHFRQRYNDEFSGHLKVEGPTTADDWKAFFDLLEVSLARLLGVAEGQVASKRALLTFAKEPVLGCGEHWPVSSVGIDGLKSAANRRVDFVFLEEEGYPSLQPQTPPGYELYGTPLRFRRDVVPIDLDVAQLAWLRLALVDHRHRPYASRRFHLSMGGKTVEGTTNERGVLEQRVEATSEAPLRLTFWPYGDPDGVGVTLRLDLSGPSSLDPISESQARLSALGYYSGEIDGTPNRALAEARRAYARERDLDPAEISENAMLADARDVQGSEPEAVA